jgi:hypothetical protein
MLCSLPSVIVHYVPTTQKLPYAFFIISIVLLTSPRTPAQNKRPLPGNLNQDSSVSEILTWLDQTSFRNARVVLKDSWDVFTYRPPWDEMGPTKNTFIFTQGFRVTNIDGCNLMLRNDDARTVTKSKVDESPHRLIADVWVQLDRTSPNKGRSTHRYTKDPEKGRLLGAWRTEFKYRGWFSRTMVGLTLYSDAWKEPQRWVGLNVAFSFDTKEMSDNFDAAFRRAIRLCQI